MTINHGAARPAPLEQFQTGDMVQVAKDDDMDVHQLGVVGIFVAVVDNATYPAFDAIFGTKLELLHDIQFRTSGTR